MYANLTAGVQLNPKDSIVNDKYRVIHEIYAGIKSHVYSISFTKEGRKNVRAIKVVNVFLS